jgi:hypothetical protein
MKRWQFRALLSKVFDGVLLSLSHWLALTLRRERQAVPICSSNGGGLAKRKDPSYAPGVVYGALKRERCTGGRGER